METTNRWDALPEECKLMILSRLSTREVARIARVSKEFLRAVNILRSSVHLLVLPPTLSPSGLEGMVTAHRNVKSLSFKRCGGKLKTFVPIIKAAATGCVTVLDNDGLEFAIRGKKKLRSLTAVDFRNCMNLIDTDVSILCSLHSRLEEVNLTNCQFMTDTALLTLSRYQHVEKPVDPLEKYTCYPRVFDKSSKPNPDEFTESEEMFLKGNDAAVYEEIQGLRLNSSNSRSWPKIGEKIRKESSAYSQFSSSSRKYEEGKILAASPYTNTTTRGDMNASANVSMGLKKSYVQMAAKSLAKPEPPPAVDHEIVKETTIPLPVQHSEPDLIEKIKRGTCVTPSVKPADVEDPSLTFIDWSLCDLGNRTTAKPDGEPLGDVDLLSTSGYRSSTSSTVGGDDQWNTEAAATNRYRDMYKHYLIDEVERPTRPLPDLIDKLCLSNAEAKDSKQLDYTPDAVNGGLPLPGTSFSNFETSVSGNKMMRTQTNLFIPTTAPQSSAAEGNGASKQKAVCVAGGTQIHDQRVRIDPSVGSAGGMTPDANSEAICRTVNHVGIFAVPDATRSKVDSSNGEIRESLSKYLENGRHSVLGDVESRSQLAILLPDTSKIGGISRRNVPAGQSPDSASSESTLFFDDGDATPELEIDLSRRIPGLRTVSVASCPEITDRGVQALLKGTSRTCLTTLDVSRCGGVTNAGLKLPARSGLQHLIAIQMPAINRLVYQLPIQSVLQHINLAGCYKLEEFVLVASALKTLNLSNCKKLARLHLKCPSLTALNISLCDSLERFGKLQCSSLQSLNAMGCRALSQPSLNAAVDSASELQDLRCGGCDRVERLDLVQSKLRTLEVAGSQTLKRIFCRSKALRVVDACGCKNLAEVYLYSPYLRRMLFSNCALLQVLVIPLDAIKDTMDAAAAAQSEKAGGTRPDELEIAISGCNMPEAVKKNLTKLTKQWQSCFKSASAT